MFIKKIIKYFKCQIRIAYIMYAVYFSKIPRDDIYAPYIFHTNLCVDFGSKQPNIRSLYSVGYIPPCHPCSHEETGGSDASV